MTAMSVLMERDAALVEDAWHFHVACLDFQNVVFAVFILLIDPFTDRIARKQRFLTAGVVPLALASAVSSD